jgi:hypothetical protein
MKIALVLALGLFIGMLGAASDDTQLVAPVWESR